MFSSARPSAPSCLLCTDQSDLTSALFSAPSRQLSLKCSFITSFSHLCHLSVLPPYYPSFLSFCPFPSTLPLSPVLTVKRTPPEPLTLPHTHSHPLVVAFFHWTFRNYLYGNQAVVYNCIFQSGGVRWVGRFEGR